MRNAGRSRIAVAAAVALTAGTAWMAASGAGVAARAQAAAQAGDCTVNGTVTAVGGARLPGVVITGVATDGRTVSTSSALDGTYRLDVPQAGRYQLKAELAVFAPITREVTVDSTCRATADLQMTLASRVAAGDLVAGRPGAEAPATDTNERAANNPKQQSAGGRERQRAGSPGSSPAPQGQGGFRRVTPVAEGRATDTQNANAEDPEAVVAHLSLPPGFSPDTLSQSVTAFGSSGQTNEGMLFGGGREAMFAGREGGPGMPGMPAGVAVAGDQAGGSSTFGQFGLPGASIGGGPPEGGRAAGGAAMGGGRGMGPGGGGRGGMGPGIGPGGMGRGAPGQPGLAGRLALGVRQNNRPRGQLSYTLGGSPLDSRPYSLTGKPAEKPQYLQQRISGSIGGPLKIPRLFDAGARTSFFLNYAGNHSSNLYSQYSTVPSLAERAGDFSALSVPLIDPVTRQPFPGNQIPLARLDPAAVALLAYIPTPNQDGARQNFYYSTTNRTSSDDINFRFIRSFGSTERRPGARGGGAGGGGRAGGGRGGGIGGGYNLNVGLHYQRSNSTQADPFPTIHGTNSRSGWDVPVSFNFPTRGLLHSVRFDFNRSHSATSNAFAYVTDLAGQAGIGGIAADPFDWGLPTLSFSSVSALSDITPGLHNDQTLTVSDSIVKLKGRHSIRFGAEFRDLRGENRTDANARGAFVFTGLYTAATARVGGSDFADFLLGLPQQASVQYGPGLERLRSRSVAGYLQDDWRIRSNFTINAGVRYEYQSPYWEANNRLVNLDVAAGFVAAAPVQAGGIGEFTGQVPATVIQPDRNNVAPRLGVAWRPRANYIVRGGYGINYASVPYLSIAQKMAGQPPFAVTDTRIGTAASPLLLTDAFGPTAAGTTNNFGVDRSYSIGYVHIWNLDVQRDFGRTMSMGASYIGTKGAQLDILRAPNRGPSGLRIAGVQPFIWESSGGRSLMNSLSLRVNRRLAQGLSGGATYTLSKSMDDASSIGGAGAVVAQNDQDLAAEWGLSSFDQRHRFSGTFTWELPFGANRKWMNTSGIAAKVFGGWILNGTFAAASGTPFTARVLGDVTDVARGTNGTLRADYSGVPIAIPNPTVAQFFNTAAFTVPTAGTFGNSARNLIIGPGSGSLSAALMKNFELAGTRGLSVRIQGTNILNQVQFSAIDATVNSPTFGQVTSVRPMRSLQVILRVMY